MSKAKKKQGSKIVMVTVLFTIAIFLTPFIFDQRRTSYSLSGITTPTTPTYSMVPGDSLDFKIKGKIIKKESHEQKEIYSQTYVFDAKLTQRVLFKEKDESYVAFFVTFNKLEETISGKESVRKTLIATGRHGVVAAISKRGHIRELIYPSNHQDTWSLYNSLVLVMQFSFTEDQDIRSWKSTELHSDGPVLSHYQIKKLTPEISTIEKKLLFFLESSKDNMLASQTRDRYRDIEGPSSFVMSFDNALGRIESIKGGYSYVRRLAETREEYQLEVEVEAAGSDHEVSNAKEEHRDILRKFRNPLKVRTSPIAALKNKFPLRSYSEKEMFNNYSDFTQRLIALEFDQDKKVEDFRELAIKYFTDHPFDISLLGSDIRSLNNGLKGSKEKLDFIIEILTQLSVQGGEKILAELLDYPDPDSLALLAIKAFENVESCDANTVTKLISRYRYTTSKQEKSATLVTLSTLAHTLKVKDESLSKRVIDNLQQIINTMDLSKEYEAILNYIGNSGSPSFLRIVKYLLSSSDPQIRKKAIYQLRHMPIDDTSEILIPSILKDNNIEVKYSGLEALSTGESSAKLFTVLEKIYKQEKDVNVRRRTMDLLAEKGSCCEVRLENILKVITLTEIELKLQENARSLLKKLSLED